MVHGNWNDWVDRQYMSNTKAYEAFTWIMYFSGYGVWLG
jgi:hypothetical protein